VNFLNYLTLFSNGFLSRIEQAWMVSYSLANHGWNLEVKRMDADNDSADKSKIYEGIWGFEGISGSELPIQCQSRETKEIC